MLSSISENEILTLINEAEGVIQSKHRAGLLENQFEEFSVR